MMQPTNHHALKKSVALQRRDANDADLHASNLTNWQQEYDQISSGSFSGSIVELPFADLQVFREDTNQALQQKCLVWPDSVWLGIPLAKQQDCRINGLSVSNSTVMCRPGDCDFDLSTPCDYSLYGMVVERSTLLSTAQVHGLELNWQELHDFGRLKVPAKTLGDVRFVLARLLQENAQQACQRMSHDLLMMALLELLKLETPEPPRTQSYQHRKQVVDQVRNFIDAYPDTPLTVTDLCATANVSRRTLQYSFESILGISPIRYLRVSRLNGVRRALMQAEHDACVTDLASQWGFWHMSQFAKDYRDLFGELPSQTLETRPAELLAQQNL